MLWSSRDGWRHFSMKYGEYQHLLFEYKEDGVLLVTINRPEVLNATNRRLHWELTQVWKDVDDDPKANVILITGAGRAFSAGGDMEMIEEMTRSPDAVAQSWPQPGHRCANMRNPAT